MDNVVEFKRPNNPTEVSEIKIGIEDVKAQTNTSFLRAFYVDNSLFWQVVRIIKWEKDDPAKMIDTLQVTRDQFNKLNLPEAANDEKYDIAA